MDTISERIKTSRKEAGMTQQQLADRCGVSKSAISQYETGAVSEIESKIMYRMSVALNVRLEWLISGLGLNKPKADNQAVNDQAEKYKVLKTNETGLLISEKWEVIPVALRKAMWAITFHCVGNSMERRSSKSKVYSKKERRIGA